VRSPSVAALALTALLLTAPPIVGAAESAAQPTETQVNAALAKIKEDPNLGVTKKRHRLKWKTKDTNQSTNPHGGEWLQWLADAISWFGTTARLLLWVIGILAAGLLGLFIKRFLEVRGDGPSALQVITPTHVRDLDIRPESLPDNIGASALAMWERGERRPALALLYRGTLSRLAHVHGVPIRDSSTEGDCLQLANAHLPAAPSAYVTRLIRAWQRAVYGGADPTEEAMRSLCAEFADALAKPASAATLTEQPA
jgi:hypothetical protein